MTRDEIAQAMQDSAGYEWGNEAHFQRFAALVAAAEREECAQICYGLAFETAGDEAEGMRQCAATIRARSKT